MGAMAAIGSLENSDVVGALVQLIHHQKQELHALEASNCCTEFIDSSEGSGAN